MEALVPAVETVQSTKEYASMLPSSDEEEISRKKWQSILRWLEGFIFNKNVSRYFLTRPGNAIICPLLMVDFQRLTSIAIDLVDDLRPVAQLPSPYKEQMMVQLASYMARIPVDREPDSESVAEQLIAPRSHA